MTCLQKPAPVLPGRTIGIVAPSGPVAPERVARGIARLESWGYRTLVGESVLACTGYLAGSDEARAADFHAIWANPDVDAVFCARGGYGAMRLLDLLDWDLLRSTPKFFCGFSDITALHVAMEKRARLITFHGPMAAAFGSEAYNSPHLLTALQNPAPLGRIAWPEPGEGAPIPIVIREGVAEGRLIGGNLSLLCALMGTPWEPDFAGRLVLLEDIAEAPYRIDRMLTQLLLSGRLQQAAGILFGDSPTCMYGPDDRPSQTLLDVLCDRLRPLGIPVLYGFPAGHTAYRATLPLGVHARLDAGAADLMILESALAT